MIKKINNLPLEIDYKEIDVPGEGDEMDTVPKFYIIENEINSKIDYLENDQVLVKLSVSGNDIILKGINKETNNTEFVITIDKDELRNTLQDIISVLN